MDYCYDSLWAAGRATNLMRDYGNWFGRRADSEGLAIYVQDDFGELIEVSSEADHCATQFRDSGRVLLDEWAWLHLERRDALLGYQGPADPVAAELSEPYVAYEGGPLNTDITVGRDDGPLARSRLYLLDVAGNYDGPLYLTHAQLCALVSAAEQLIKPAPRRQGRPS